MTELTIYALDLANKVHIISGLLTVFSLLGLGLSSLVYCLTAIADGEVSPVGKALFKRCCRICFIVSIPSCTLFFFIPDSKTLAYVYFLPKLAESQKIPKELAPVIKSYLDCEIEATENRD